MNDRLTIAPGVETQAASKHSGQPAAAPALHPWARPVFERVRLNEALGYPVGNCNDGQMGRTYVCLS